MGKIKFVNCWIWQWFSSENGINASGEFCNSSLIVNNESGFIEQMQQNEEEKQENIDEIIDLGGMIVLPGLIDSHIHLEYTGKSAYYGDLSSCDSISEFKQAVQQHAERFPEMNWVLGVKWDHSKWDRYPNRHDLDEVVPDRPVFLYRACWHICVCNSKALEVVGISLTPSSPLIVEGGFIDVEEDGITPTGILRENAVSLVVPFISEKSPIIRKRHIMEAIDQCISKGLTCVQSNDEFSWDLYSELQNNQSLPIRVFLTIGHKELTSSIEGYTVPAPIRHPSNQQDRFLSCHRVKIFSDGSLGAETAALRQPYVGSNSNYGILVLSQEQLNEQVNLAHQKGYRLEVHAIGDRAAESVLNAFEVNGVSKEDRPILTHCQVLGQDLIERMATIGVIANIQPSFVPTDAQWVQKRIEKNVQRYSYCWKTMMEHGVICAGGSDAPIETVNPFQGLYDAITRHTKSNDLSGEKKQIDDVFLPDEKLSFAQALWLYTIGGAYAAQQENYLGQLSPGFAADFVVLQPRPESKQFNITSDYLTMNPSTLLDLSVQQVWVNGKLRYSTKVQGISENSPQILEGNTIAGKNGIIHIPRLSNDLNQVPPPNFGLSICSCCRR